jgi:hypothetical protein
MNVLAHVRSTRVFDLSPGPGFEALMLLLVVSVSKKSNEGEKKYSLI